MSRHATLSEIEHVIEGWSSYAVVGESEPGVLRIHFLSSVSAGALEAAREMLSQRLSIGLSVEASCIDPISPRTRDIVARLVERHSKAEACGTCGTRAVTARRCSFCGARG